MPDLHDGWVKYSGGENWLLCHTAAMQVEFEKARPVCIFCCCERHTNTRAALWSELALQD